MEPSRWDPSLRSRPPPGQQNSKRSNNTGSGYVRTAIHPFVVHAGESYRAGVQAADEGDHAGSALHFNSAAVNHSHAAYLSASAGVVKEAQIGRTFTKESHLAAANSLKRYAETLEDKRSYGPSVNYQVITGLSTDHTELAKLYDTGEKTEDLHTKTIDLGQTTREFLKSISRSSSSSIPTSTKKD